MVAFISQLFVGQGDAYPVCAEGPAPISWGSLADASGLNSMENTEPARFPDRELTVRQPSSGETLARHRVDWARVGVRGVRPGT